jgi:hypothetical protein
VPEIEVCCGRDNTGVVSRFKWSEIGEIGSDLQQHCRKLGYKQKGEHQKVYETKSWRTSMELKFDGSGIKNPDLKPSSSGVSDYLQKIFVGVVLD